MRGPVRLFARHPTAGNLLMALMLLAGIAGLTQINRQFFPEFGIDVITVTVEWPGATAEDVEGTVIAAVEPELRFLDGVKRVLGVAAEGTGLLYVEFVAGADMQAALSDVESAVAQVTTLPADAERPQVRRIVRYDTIGRLVLSGPYPEAALKIFAKRIRDDLLARGADRVTLYGTRDEEIRVETDPATLRRLDLTLEDVARAIGRASQDVPAGRTEGGAVERQPRTLGLARTAEEVAAIEVRSWPGGRKLTVGEIARVEEGFDADAGEGRRGGRPAVELHVQRATGADALAVAAAVDAYLAELRPTLPANLTLEAYDDAASLIEDRIGLLVRNGLSGLVLVVGVLFLFLNARIALWVAAGIPIAMLAMIGALWLAGMTINMISLFAMILAIGIVVDDAIVVGEHAATLGERGVPPLAAAERGALEMLAPVTSATLTTVAAFLPVLVIGGVIGQVIREIPLVVIAVLLASLVECFLVLPTHLRGALAAGAAGRTTGARRALNGAFERFRAGPFRRLVRLAVEWRYATLAAAVAALVLAGGAIAGGRTGFVFFTGPESSTVYANLVMAPGTGRAETARALAAVDDALARAEAGLTGGGTGGLVLMGFGRLGESVAARPGEPRLSGDNVASLHVELVASDRRAVRTAELIEAWRAAVPPLPGVESLTLTEQFSGPPGREVDLRLRGVGADPATLKRAALEVRALLERLPGVSGIDDDLPYGRPEVLIELTPRGRALGFTTEEVGRQLRDALQGRIAKRFPRGDEEVEVRVRLTDAARAGLDLEDFALRGPTGRRVPLAEVATLRPDRGFARIQREDGVRRVAVTAELDEDVIQLDPLIAALESAGLPEIAARHGLEYRFAGKAEEQAETMADVRLGAVIALALIYIVLAWVFGSFARPLAVMAVIPFGVVGAVLGHLLMGYDLSMMSLIALLGLSGILVNDSIVLVTAIDGLIREGRSLAEAVVEGACARLRAVILTSATTIGGLLPLLFETSFQARFLIPMAVTICFGLLVTTLLVLFVVPALLVIQTDLGALLRRPAGGRRAAEMPAA